MTSIRLIVSEPFNRAIWRMEIDELSETLFIETRSTEDKQVSFSAVSLAAGKILFKDITTPERWLTGIEAAFDGVLLLHNYQTETGPAHKGLIAIDGTTAEVLWSNYIYAFDHLSANGPILYDARIHPRKFLLADVKTGETTRIYEPPVYKHPVNHILRPAMMEPGELPSEFSLLHPFGNMVHYLEHNNFRIVSLHALKGGQLTQSLYVAHEGNIVYEDLLNADIQKIQPEAFIMHKGRLIYIKNKSDLRVLSL